jgi:thymidylate synthase (FAD)
VIESGHGSTIEHVVFTFAISGVSRTLSHQLVRHRAGRRLRPAEPALREVQGRGDDAAARRSPRPTRDLRERYEQQVDGALELYGELVGAGVPGEDARFVFPNATRTNLVMTTNLRALIHMSGLRLCTMAQWEIRRLFQLIRHEIFQVSPFLGSFLAPKCVPLGYCDEIATATSTARSGPTRTACSRRGPRRPPPRERRVGSCRSARRGRAGAVVLRMSLAHQKLNECARPVGQDALGGAWGMRVRAISMSVAHHCGPEPHFSRRAGPPGIS